MINLLIKKAKIIEQDRMRNIEIGSVFIYRFKAGDKTQRFPKKFIIEGCRRYLPGEILEILKKNLILSIENY